MSWLDDLFGGGNNNNPADAAKPYYDKIPGVEHGAYDPYIQRGNAAYGKFNPILDQMTSDPTGFLQKIMGGYNQSKDYQLKNEAMTRAAGNSAAAGGQRGSLGDISNQARITDSLMGDDMQTWLHNVLGIQDKGMQGEEGLYSSGFDATRDLTGDLSNVLGTQGTLEFQGQANKNKSRSDLLSALAKLGAGGAAWHFGGPVGAEAASKFF